MVKQNRSSSFSNPSNSPNFSISPNSPNPSNSSNHANPSDHREQNYRGNAIWGGIGEIACKELLELKTNSALLPPLLILPFLFGIILPVGTILLSIANSDNLHFIFHENIFPLSHFNIPSCVVSKHGRLIYVLLNIFFMPIILMIPVTSAIRTSVLSFSEEKESEVIERSLTTSFASCSITAGKVLASFIVSLVFSWITVALYIGVGALLEKILIGGTLFNWSEWAIIAFLLVPSIAILSILVVIGFSLYTRTARTVNLLSSLVAVPIVILLITQIVGGLGVSLLFLLICGLVTLAIDIIGLIFLSKCNRQILLIGPLRKWYKK